MELSNSKRVLNAATYVTRPLGRSETADLDLAESSRAFQKLQFLEQIPNHSEPVILALKNAAPDELKPKYETLRLLTRSVSPVVDSLRLGRAQLAGKIPWGILVQYAEAIPATDVPNMARLSAATELFKQQMLMSPVGWIHLEKIEMIPAGLERGELVGSIALTPGEVTRISHKEWSTSKQEYETIVQDYFESYSERGVAEKADFSQSTENESRHSLAVNFTASGSGGFGPVSISTSTGINSTLDDREVIRQSAQRSREVTEKASARVRKEHKVSFKTDVASGTEDNAVRRIVNHSANPVRFDYFRLMRKWRTNLLRYGMRLTFDFALPDPGSRLWALYRKLRSMDAELLKPFIFELKPTDITDQNWQILGATYRSVLDFPPRATLAIQVTRKVSTGVEGGSLEEIEFAPPAGYVTNTEVKGAGSFWSSEEPYSTPPFDLPANSSMVIDPVPPVHTGHDFKFTSHLEGSTQRRFLKVWVHWGATINFDLQAGADRLPETYYAWQVKCWNILKEAASNSYQQAHVRLQAQRDELWSGLMNKDTLSLRRLEREELMRSVLFWVFGPNVVDVAPGATSLVLKKIVDQEGSDTSDAVGQPTTPNISENERSTAMAFGEVIKFFHHAIEWENLIYFLYPYFWGSDDLARERILFEHPDPNHRDFLRAGYARVVLPLRPGFEKQLISFMQTGQLNVANLPYLSIGDEIRLFAQTNYNSIAPANPEKNYRPLLFPEQQSTWASILWLAKRIEDHRATPGNGGYPKKLGDLAGNVPKDAWGRDFIYRCPGLSGPFDLTSFGANGVEGGEGLDADISTMANASLIATWYDYTPTSALDIAANSDLSQIS